MKWLQNIWQKIKSWWLKQPCRLHTIIVEEVPEVLALNSVYLIGENGYYWFIAMSCPCKCKAIIQLSLLPEGRPHWKLTQHNDGTISLSPSIWRTKGCGSHFFLRRGIIEWCITHDG